MGKTTTSVTGASSSRSAAVPNQQLAVNASSAEIAVGLQQIEKIFYDPGRQAYIVETAEGRVAVSLSDQPSITHDGNVSEQLLQAAYARALGEQAANATLDAPDAVLELGDLRDQLVNVASQMADFQTEEARQSPEYQALLQRQQELQEQYSAKAGELMNEEIAVCQQEVADVPVNSPASRRVEMKRRAEAAGRKLRSFIRGENRRQATLAQAVLFGVNEEGEVNLPSEEKFEQSRQAARALGGEHLIPDYKLDFTARCRQCQKLLEEHSDGQPCTLENGQPAETDIISVGEVHANQDYRDAMELFNSRVNNGGVRFVALSGPPSTGKDTFAEQMAAGLGMPLITQNVGPGKDIQDLLGGEGLGPKEVYDEEGKLVDTVAGSKRIVGSLAEAAQHRAAYVITEIEGMEDDLVRLNTLFGARVGEPDKRSVTAGSISDDDEIIPHEDFLIFVTYNPGHDDIKLPSSVAARALNLSFEYAPIEEESEIVSKMAMAVAKQDDNIPGIKEREVTPEEVRPVVELVRRFRNQHATDPHKWKDQPDMRQAAHIYHDLLSLGYEGNQNALGVTIRRTLAYTLPGSMELPASQRDEDLDGVIRDYEQQLAAIVQLGYSMRPDAQQQEG